MYTCTLSSNIVINVIPKVGTVINDDDGSPFRQEYRKQPVAGSSAHQRCMLENQRDVVKRKTPSYLA